MKKLIIFLIIIFWNCSTKENEIENIEISSYYYNLNEKQTELKMEFLNYSIIDANGNMKSIQKIQNSENDYLFFNSKIAQENVEKIATENRKLTDKNYEMKAEVFSGVIYCGPTIRVKIKYRDKKELTFNYTEDKTETKFSAFIKVQRLIAENYNLKNYTQIENMEELKKKQKEFEKYAINKDTLNFSFPPMPKKGKIIKFTK